MNKKKISFFLLFALLIFVLTACSDNKEDVPTIIPTESTKQVEAPTATNTVDEGTQNTPVATESEDEGGQDTPTITDTEEHGREPRPLNSEEKIATIWQSLIGYWNAAEGRFVVIDAMDSNTNIFAEGIWDTSYRMEGTVTKLALGDENELLLTVLYPATEATEMDDARPEKVETAIIDYSGLAQDGKIRIKIGDGEWRQYAFAAGKQEEAYQVYIDNMQSDLKVTGDTEEEQIASLWKLIEGCWADDEKFLLFVYDDAGKPICQYGTWEYRYPLNTRAPGIVTSISNFDGVSFSLGITFLPNEENAADEQDLIQYQGMVIVGIDDLKDGIITAVTTEDAYGSYTRIANSYNEAYNIISQGN